MLKMTLNSHPLTIILLIFVIQAICNVQTLNADNSLETITINWNETYQTLKGFGAFAASGDVVYNHPQKEKIFDSLFGKNGLKLTAIRSTLPPNMNFTHVNDETPETWFQKQAKSKYGVSMFIASAWSPPYRWKSRKGQSTGANMNYLLESHYDEFAKYMADYVEYRKQIGLELYAISPQNEPEFATTDWDGCVWLPQQTAKFVRSHLKPIFSNRTLSTKIIIGENANWNVANLYLHIASMLVRNEDFDIYASHGYSFPNYPKFYVTYNQHVVPWYGMRYQKERWITEASSTDKYDGSMKKGLELAISLSRFLTEGNINGYIFWNSVLGNFNNQALVLTNGTRIVYPRVYHVYGHFTRFIKPGHIRMKASKSFFPLISDMEVVAFKDPKTNSFTVVLTNYSSKQKSSVVKLSDMKINHQSVHAIVTNENQEWAPIGYNLGSGDGTITMNIPGNSIVTITATAQ